MNDLDPIRWIKAHVPLEPATSAEALYDRMASQSGECLAVIYQPFDAQKRGHFVDRAQILDFAVSAGGGRVLDFGPGDGWPSLLLAPSVREVVGVDGSRRRVEVCTANAARLGLSNARFVHAPPGSPLPLEDASFDAVVAASSIEQTPDPRQTLAELARVLKPGGRLRASFETLEGYRGGAERHLAVIGGDERRALVLLFDRHVDAERVEQYGLLVDLSRGEVDSLFGGKPSWAALTQRALEALRGRLVQGLAWTTRHPSGPSLLRWAREAGFARAGWTHSAGAFARRLFDRLPATERPGDLAAVDRFLRPIVETVVTLRAPPDADGMLAAVR